MPKRYYYKNFKLIKLSATAGQDTKKVLTSDDVTFTFAAKITVNIFYGFLTAKFLACFTAG